MDEGLDSVVVALRLDGRKVEEVDQFRRGYDSNTVLKGCKLQCYWM